MCKTSLSLSILCCIRNSSKRTPRIQFESFKLRRTDSTMREMLKMRFQWTLNCDRSFASGFTNTLFGKNHFNQARQNGWITVQGTITMHCVPRTICIRKLYPRNFRFQSSVFLYLKTNMFYTVYFRHILGNGIIMFLTYELLTPLNRYFSCSHYDKYRE